MQKRKKKYEPIETANLNTFPMELRDHKVELDGMAKLPQKGATAAELLDSMPKFLGAEQLRSLANKIVDAYHNERPVIFAMGAHVIKVGCSTIIIDLIRRGIIAGIAMNGAGAIHDFEMAHAGQTSEDVAENLRLGKFGMTTETPEILAAATAAGCKQNTGLGAAIGEIINKRQLPNRNVSLFAAADECGILATIHVAIGTDTVHMHPSADGETIGKASLIDFRKLCSAVADMAGGGVWVNAGSAVILPEVFLKAVSVARNLGADLDEMYTANLDMIRHYRVQQNVLQRPVEKGHSFQVVGHHEITLPLLRMLILEKI